MIFHFDFRSHTLTLTSKTFWRCPRNRTSRTTPPTGAQFGTDHAQVRAEVQATLFKRTSRSTFLVFINASACSSYILALLYSIVQFRNNFSILNWSIFHSISVASRNDTILQQISVKNNPCFFKWRDLNSQLVDRQSVPVTTSPWQQAACCIPIYSDNNIKLKSAQTST